MDTHATQWASHNAGTLQWLVVAAYLVGAMLCARQYRVSGEARERVFWALAALGMLGLGLNKQLDLQTQLTAFGRQLARDGGWYEDRRTFQAAFVMVGGVVALAMFGGLAWLVHGLRAGVIVALAGLCLLAVFVMVRAASFHHVDAMMRTEVFGLRLHKVLELAGIVVVIIGASLPRQVFKPVPYR